jgi:hypothetical protein
MRLVQAYSQGDPPSAIPIDQVIITEQDQHKVLLLPKGKFWFRRTDRDSNVIAKRRESVH